MTERKRAEEYGGLKYLGCERAVLSATKKARRTAFLFLRPGLPIHQELSELVSRLAVGRFGRLDAAMQDSNSIPIIGLKHSHLSAQSLEGFVVSHP